MLKLDGHLSDVESEFYFVFVLSFLQGTKQYFSKVKAGKRFLKYGLWVDYFHTNIC